VFCTYHPLLFKCHNISWKVQIVNLFIMKSHHHHHLVTSFLLGQVNLCNDLVLYSPNLCSSLRVRQSFTPFQTISKCTLLLCLLMNGVITCVLQIVSYMKLTVQWRYVRAATVIIQAKKSLICDRGLRALWSIKLKHVAHNVTNCM